MFGYPAETLSLLFDILHNVRMLKEHAELLESSKKLVPQNVLNNFQPKFPENYCFIFFSAEVLILQSSSADTPKYPIYYVRKLEDLLATTRIAMKEVSDTL